MQITLHSYYYSLYKIFSFIIRQRIISFQCYITDLTLFHHVKYAYTRLQQYLTDLLNSLKSRYIARYRIIDAYLGILWNQSFPNRARASEAKNAPRARQRRRPSRKVVSSWPTYTGCIKYRALSLSLAAQLKAKPQSRMSLTSMSRYH